MAEGDKEEFNGIVPFIFGEHVTHDIELVGHATIAEIEGSDLIVTITIGQSPETQKLADIMRGGGVVGFTAATFEVADTNPNNRGG